MAPDTEVHGDAVSPEEVAAAAVRVAEPRFVDGVLHWLATPPDGSGRAVLWREHRDGAPEAVSPLSISLRSSLFGYGADAWCAGPIGVVGIEAASRQLGVVTPGSFRPLGAAVAVGDALGDPAVVHGSTWVVVAEERHAAKGARRGLLAVDVATGAESTLHVATGFCAEPQCAPDGATLAWLEWPAGTMPWDAARLMAAPLVRTGGALSLGAPRRVDGGPGCSTGQPTWRPDGSLCYVSEAAGYWQPWACDDGGAVRRLCGRRAEFQRPRWLTCRWLAALGEEGALACAFADGDGEHVGVLARDGALHVLDQPCVRIDGVAADRARLAWVGATPRAQGAVYAAGWSEGAVRPAAAVAAAPAARGPVARPERFELDVADAHLVGALWRPVGDPTGPSPLVLTVHPGPTGAVDHAYAAVVHLLVSRGFAVASLDYSGSTAHGRAHRERLGGRFGALDVDECVAAVAHLVERRVADARALFVRGTSAGGTTALCALASGRFLGAVAWYPASDFTDTAEGFEAGYLAALVGAGGEGCSPIARAPSLRGSVLVVQGEDDDVVTPEATARLLVALRVALEDVSYVAVPGEGHGFRTAAGRAAALRAELEFYERRTVAATGTVGRYDAGRRGSTPSTAPTPP